MYLQKLCQNNHNNKIKKVNDPNLEKNVYHLMRIILIKNSYYQLEFYTHRNFWCKRGILFLTVYF